VVIGVGNGSAWLPVGGGHNLMAMNRKKRCWSPDAIEKRWVEYFNRAIN